MYFVQGIVTLLHAQAEHAATASDYLIEATFAAGLALTLLALIGIRALLLPGGVMSTVGFYAAFVGHLALLADAISYLTMRRDALGVAFMLGLLLAVVGTILLGIAIIRSRKMPVWAGAVLIVMWPLVIGLDDRGGNLLQGIAWAAIAYALAVGYNYGQAAAQGRAATG